MRKQKFWIILYKTKTVAENIWKLYPAKNVKVLRYSDRNKPKKP